MTRIFDNNPNSPETVLGTRLQEMLRTYARMDTAVGYFNLRGWAQFADLVDAKPLPDDGTPVVRILIGMVSAGFHREAIDVLQAEVSGDDLVGVVDREQSETRKNTLIGQLRDQLSHGIPNMADRRTLHQLHDQLASGKVQVRVYTRKPLHGKTYILHRDDISNPMTGYVGSSNLTGPGLRSNTELNVDVQDNDGAEHLNDWFIRHWDDDYCWRVTGEIIDLIEKSWVGTHSPWQVFMKVCYDLSRDVRDGQNIYAIPPKIAGQLMDFQATAVRTLARRIVTRGGTMLGDVVGLGKTITALAVACMLYEEHGMRPLVICPKNLTGMWRDGLADYDLPGRVVSYSMAAKELPDLRRYEFVIVDESHTLRNDKRQDYVAIHDYIHTNDSKVLALTATPYNKEYRDVANQVGLWLDDDTDLGISPDTALTKDPGLKDKLDGKITTLAAFRRSEEPTDWKRLMSENLVRRTRSFVQANYAQTDEKGHQFIAFPDGRRFTFPTRTAIPVDHTFGAGDPARLMASEDTLNVIERLILPRYSLAGYIRPRGPRNDEEKQWIDGLERGRGHVAGFARTTFYKRLSSGGQAFILTVRRHIARNRLVAYALQNNLEVPFGTLTPADTAEDTDQLDDRVPGEPSLGTDESRYDALRQANPSGIVWRRPGLFTARLAADLDTDTASLQHLLDSWGPWTPDRDSKLQKLIELATVTHPGDKLLVFTEYTDTADYLAAQLTDAGIDRVGVVTGDSDNPTRIATQFSPGSNAKFDDGRNLHAVDPAEELRVLIATDVVSEGQNLQDAHIVVNYDLPWAIIRLIQRAGRVDRFGQHSDHVLIYSMFHDSLEQVINLRRRIAGRLADNAAVFGSDEDFFGTADEISAVTDLYNGTLDEQTDGDLGDVDAGSLAYEYWTRALEIDPDLATRIPRLPPLIDATRPKRPQDSDTGVACYVRTASGLDGYGFTGSDGESRILTGYEALRVFVAEPTTPSLPRQDGHDERVKELAQGVLSAPDAIGGLHGVRLRVWRRFVGNQATIPTMDWDDDVKVALDDLHTHPLTRTAEESLRRALRDHLTDDQLADRLKGLWSDGDLIFTSAQNSTLQIITSMGITA